MIHNIHSVSLNLQQYPINLLYMSKIFCYILQSLLHLNISRSLLSIKMIVEGLWFVVILSMHMCVCVCMCLKFLYSRNFILSLNNPQQREKKISHYIKYICTRHAILCRTMTIFTDYEIKHVYNIIFFWITSKTWSTSTVNKTYTNTEQFLKMYKSFISNWLWSQLGSYHMLYSFTTIVIYLLKIP
jgi:hypothetical protein